MKTRVTRFGLLLVAVVIVAVLVKVLWFPTLGQRLRGGQDLHETRDDLAGARAAIYVGHDMDEHSALALGRALQWMGCHVESLDADSIRGGSLDSFHLLAIPGGGGQPDPWAELGPEGRSEIQSFVDGGGGYLGVCLGALYASDKGDFWGVELAEDELYLDLFPGIAYCGQEETAPQGVWPLMTWLDRGQDSHPIVASMPDRIRIVYYPSSPYLRPYRDADVTIVATYESSGNPAMVAFEYGRGRVFLSGPHPEIEVDSDRDGSDWFDDLDDEGSEWPLLLAVAKWLTKQ